MRIPFSTAGDWAMIEAQLPPDFRELAESMGLIKAWPEHLGAKITDASLLLRLILFHVTLCASLKVTCAAAAAAGLVDISPVALHLRMRKSGPYLATLLSKMVGTQALFATSKWANLHIVVVDATVVTRPGAKGTTARLHYALRLADLAVVECHVTDDSVGETFRNFHPRMDELWMGDRGYAHPPGIAAMTNRGAYVLVRYNFGSLPLYEEDGTLIDVHRKLTHVQQEGRIHAWTVYVHPHGKPILRGRLVVMRLPRDKAEEARARVQAEMGAAVTPQALHAAQYLILFTTVPRTLLSAEEIVTLYCLRWQVELRFKRDKSIGELDCLPNFRPDTIHSWLCAKLLAQQVAQKVATPEVAFPPPRSDAPPSQGRWKRILDEMRPRITAEAWRVTVLTWKTLSAALLPIGLRDLPEALGRFLAHLFRYRNRKRPTSKERFAAVCFAGVP